MNENNLLSMCMIMVVICVAIVALVGSCEVKPEPKAENYFFYQGYGYRSLRPATYEELKAMYDGVNDYYFNYYDAISKGKEPIQGRSL